MTDSTLRNYSTKVPVTRTIGEMQDNLVKHGANRVSIDYAAGDPCALSFTLTTPHGPRHFTMPVLVDPVHALLIAQDRAGKLKQGGAASSRTSIEQANRVAWRVMADWLDAQLSLVAAQMTTLTTVMLPYLHVDAAGHTLAEAYAERESALELTGGA